MNKNTKGRRKENSKRRRCVERLKIDEPTCAFDCKRKSCAALRSYLKGKRNRPEEEEEDEDEDEENPE